MTMQAPGITPGPGVDAPAKQNGVPHAHAQSMIPKAIVDAIRIELKKLVETDDLDSSLIQLEHVVVRSRELFMTFKAPHARFRGAKSSAMPVMGTMSSLSMMSDGYGSSYPSSSSPFAPPEQFGARAIRELIALVPEILNARADASAPDKLVEAIALAKKNGEEDLAKQLTARLLAKPEDVTERISNRLKALLHSRTAEQPLDLIAQDNPDGTVTFGAEPAQSNGAPPINEPSPS